MQLGKYFHSQPITQAEPFCPTPISLAQAGMFCHELLFLLKTAPSELTIQGVPLGSTAILTAPPGMFTHPEPFQEYMPNPPDVVLQPS